MALPPGASVRVHTLQARAAFERALGVGYLTGDVEHVDRDRDHGGWGFRESYAWMVGRMGAMVPGHSGDHPVWAWPKRPSMRVSGQKAWMTEPTVLIVADVPRGRILASDYDVWHCVLNNQPVYGSEAEADAEALDDDLPGKVASWDGVFDVARDPAPSERRWHGTCRFPQLCCDRIMLEEMVRVTEHGPTGRVTRVLVDRGPVRPRRGQVRGTSWPFR